LFTAPLGRFISNSFQRDISGLLAEKQIVRAGNDSTKLAHPTDTKAPADAEALVQVRGLKLAYG
jgi:hypothetical protein